MTTADFAPRDPRELLDALAWAVAEDVPLDLFGRGGLRGYGRPIEAGGRGNRLHRLSLSAFTGIRFYEPAELVMTVGAGTPLAEVQAALAAERQHLAFEPPDFGPLYGRPAGQGTIGGVLAANLAGPRRIQAGAARDHFLGVKAVSGRGEAFKAGGRVVKNVTGFDLCKLLAGSHGTLAAMHEVTVKIVPAPEKARTVLVLGLSDAAAVEAMTAALQSPYEVSGAAHLPAALAAGSAVSFVRGAGGAVTAVRVEGVGPSVAARCASLRELLGRFGPVEELHTTNSAAFWREVRDAAPFASDQERVVWRLSVPPSAGAAVVAEIATGVSDVLAFYDWGGGLIWLGVPVLEDGAAAVVRAAVARTGGFATLMRAPDSLRSAVPVFQPQPEPLARLARATKAEFDPRRILNPGRMIAGV